MRSSLSTAENQEWQKMFGSVGADREHENAEFEVDGQNLTVPSASNRTYASDTVSSNSMQERSYIQCQFLANNTFSLFLKILCNF